MKPSIRLSLQSSVPLWTRYRLRIRRSTKSSSSASDGKTEQEAQEQKDAATGPEKVVSSSDAQPDPFQVLINSKEVTPASDANTAPEEAIPSSDIQPKLFERVGSGIRGRTAPTGSSYATQSALSQVLADSNHTITASYTNTAPEEGIASSDTQPNLFRKVYFTSDGRSIPKSLVERLGLSDRQPDPFRIDSSTKNVTTAYGTLPLSPIMDPAFHEVRGKYTINPKERGPPRVPRSLRDRGLFKGLDLYYNIYAKALATPPRTCGVTKTVLPNFFLTSFKSVKKPDAEHSWLVPTEVSLNTDGQTVLSEIPGPSVYTLCRQQLYREFFEKGSKYFNGFARVTSRAAPARRKVEGPKTAVWREDMDDFLLNLLRSHITQCLIRFAGMVESAQRTHIKSIHSWDDAREHATAKIWSLLYLGPSPQQQDPAEQTVVESADPGQLAPPPARLSMFKLRCEEGRETQVPIHDLRILLGEANIARLRERKATFRGGEAFVLKGLRTENLQLQLWRLQGYMTTPETGESGSSTPDVSSAPVVRTPEEPTLEQSTPEESTPEESTPEESTPEESTPEESTPEESTPETPSTPEASGENQSS